MSIPLMQLHRFVTAVVAYTVVDIMVHPGAYTAVGLDPRQAREVARANPHHHETRRWMAEKVVEFLTEVGMIGGPSKRLWRKAHLL